MGIALSVALITVSLAAVAGVLTWLTRRARRGGDAGSAIAGAMAAYDEAMHSTAHDQFVELQQQSDRIVPVPAPGPGPGPKVKKHPVRRNKQAPRGFSPPNPQNTD